MSLQRLPANACRHRRRRILLTPMHTPLTRRKPRISRAIECSNIGSNRIGAPWPNASTSAMTTAKPLGHPTFPWWTPVVHPSLSSSVQSLYVLYLAGPIAYRTYDRNTLAFDSRRSTLALRILGHTRSSTLVLCYHRRPGSSPIYPFSLRCLSHLAHTHAKGLSMR